MDAGSNGNGLKVMKFWAPWCSPCLAMKPTVEQAVDELGNIDLVDINIDEDVDMAREYKIRSIPTLLLIKDNHEIGRLVGNHAAERVKEFLKQS